MQCRIFSVPVDSEGAFEKEHKLNDFLGVTNVKRVFASIANQPEGPIWSVLFFYEGAERATQKSPASAESTVATGATLTGEQVKSIIALKKWRADQAAQEGVPLYMVAQNRWLEEIVQMPGRTLDDLKNVSGLGEWRVQKYGTKILEVLNTTNAAKRSWPASSYSTGRA